MTEKKCPACKCQRFYLKNPEDEYDIYEFEYKEEGITFDNQAPVPFELNETMEVFCEACAWHEKMKTFKE